MTTGTLPSRSEAASTSAAESTAVPLVTTTAETEPGNAVPSGLPSPRQNSSQPSHCVLRKTRRIRCPASAIRISMLLPSGRTPLRSDAGQDGWSAVDPEGMGRNPATYAGSESGPPGAGGRSYVGSSRGWCPSVFIGVAVSELPFRLPRLRSPVPDHLDCVAIATPPARHLLHGFVEHLLVCLLYTSDAADEEDSVDLG